MIYFLKFLLFITALWIIGERINRLLEWSINKVVDYFLPPPPPPGAA